LATIITGTFIFGLWFDQTFDFWGQTLTNIWAWLVFLLLLRRAARVQQLSLLLCLGYATLGEIFLSLIWGLYEYRLQNVPLFVPPGHVLLFTLGMTTAQKLPTWIISMVSIVMLPYIIFTTLTGFDTLGGLLFLMFLGCVVMGREKKLYATMFMLALLLELYGTWLGNWAWSPEVPWLSLTTPNPPACAGAFYCVLDGLVVSTVPYLAGKVK
jgi:hypothetical protein